MGDMADFILEQAMDHESLYGLPCSADQEDEFSPGITCRCCGAEGLRWKRLCGKWRLFSGDELHACSANPLRHENG